MLLELDEDELERVDWLVLLELLRLEEDSDELDEELREVDSKSAV